MRWLSRRRRRPDAVRLVCPAGTVMLLHALGDHDDHMIEAAADLHRATGLQVFVVAAGSKVEVVPPGSTVKVNTTLIVPPDDEPPDAGGIVIHRFGGGGGGGGSGGAGAVIAGNTFGGGGGGAGSFAAGGVVTGMPLIGEHSAHAEQRAIDALADHLTSHGYGLPGES